MSALLRYHAELTGFSKVSGVFIVSGVFMISGVFMVTFKQSAVLTEDQTSHILRNSRNNLLFDTVLRSWRLNCTEIRLRGLQNSHGPVTKIWANISPRVQNIKILFTNKCTLLLNT